MEYINLIVSFLIVIICIFGLRANIKRNKEFKKDFKEFQSKQDELFKSHKLKN